MAYEANSPFPEANEAYNYQRQYMGRGRVIVDLQGSSFEQKILTAAVSQTKLLEQIKALEGMSACAGIRGNDSAAYKARVNHYGGVSSWGKLLPFRRWVDSAYSDTTYPSWGYEHIYKNFRGKNSKVIADYIASKLTTTPVQTYRLRPKVLSYDEWLDTKEFQNWEKSFYKRYPYYAPYGVGSKHPYAHYMYQIDSPEERLRKQRANELHRQMREIEFRNLSRDGSGTEFNGYEEEGEKAGLFGMVVTGKSAYSIKPSAFMKGLAKKMEMNQKRAIRSMLPKNALATRRIKHKNTPLVWTGEMKNAIESWVEKE